LRTVPPNCLTTEQMERLRTIATANGDALRPSPPKKRAAKIAGVRILTDNVPVRTMRYRASDRVDAFLETQIAAMLEDGIIRPSSSPYASPVVCPEKKDGTLRLAVDYRKLNSRTVADQYPLPRIDDTLDALSGAEESIPKTAFITRQGLFEFLVMAFGLRNAPGAFQRVMDSVLQGLRRGASHAPRHRIATVELPWSLR